MLIVCTSFFPSSESIYPYASYFKIRDWAISVCRWGAFSSYYNNRTHSASAKDNSSKMLTHDARALCDFDTPRSVTIFSWSVAYCMSTTHFSLYIICVQWKSAMCMLCTGVFDIIFCGLCLISFSTRNDTWGEWNFTSVIEGSRDTTIRWPHHISYQSFVYSTFYLWILNDSGWNILVFSGG